MIQFILGESDTGSSEQTGKATEEYELDRFERLKEEINKENPESTAFYSAMYQTQLRKRSNSLKKSTTSALSPTARNKAPTSLSVK